MRYVLLSKLQTRNKIIRIIIMLFIIFMQNFYEKFYNKKKRVIFILVKFLISRSSNMRFDKTSNILFLNDLNLFEIF